MKKTAAPKNSKPGVFAFLGMAALVTVLPGCGIHSDTRPAFDNPSNSTSTVDSRIDDNIAYMVSCIDNMGLDEFDAAFANNPEIVDGINTPGSDGKTLLHTMTGMTYEGHFIDPEYFEIAVGYGASPFTLDSIGKTPIDNAKENGNAAAVDAMEKSWERVKEFGADNSRWQNSEVSFDESTQMTMVITNGAFARPDVKVPPKTAGAALASAVFNSADIRQPN